MSNNYIEDKIQVARSLIDQMQSHYTEFGKNIQPSQVHNTYYTDIDEYLNLRMATISSSKILADQNQAADALALCRSLLEALLLFKLIANGSRYTRSQTMDSGEDLKIRRRKFVRKQKERIGNPDVQFIDVFADERRSNCVKYVFEGLKSSEDGLVIPIYYFYYKEYDPRTHRLDFTKYNRPFPLDDELLKALSMHQSQAKEVSRNYLNYSALKDSLKLNHFIDAPGITRLEAHYTFLGSFVHPTNGSARELHKNNNVYSGGTGIGLSQPYDSKAQLLVYVYLLHLLKEFLVEYLKCYKNAPLKYVAGIDSEDIERDIESVRILFGFFWFLNGDVPDYEKFDFAVNHGRNFDFSDFNSIPAERVLFNSDIYGNFCNSLMGWSNNYWGSYSPPYS